MNEHISPFDEFSHATPVPDADPRGSGRLEATEYKAVAVTLVKVGTIYGKDVFIRERDYTPQIRQMMAKTFDTFGWSDKNR